MAQSIERLFADSSMHPRTLSLETAVIVTDRSKRTWWRRISEGRVARADRSRGTMLYLDDVRPYLLVPMEEDMLETLLEADGGDRTAQSDLGEFFLAHARDAVGFLWLHKAARQGCANAMQVLAACYAGGRGVGKDENLAIAWLARAAHAGHLTAREQLQGIRNGRAPMVRPTAELQGSQ